MKCSFCSRDFIERTSFEDDCVFKLLELTKIHYTDLKTKFAQSATTIENLKSENMNLLSAIENLKADLTLTQTSIKIKRRKTPSLNSSTEILEKVQNIIPPNKSTNDENLNKQQEQQQQQTSSINKKIEDKEKGQYSPITHIIERKMYPLGKNFLQQKDKSLSNKSIHEISPTICPSNQIGLPRRIKSSSDYWRLNKENNKQMLNTMKRKSKEESLTKNIADKNWNTSYLESIKSPSVDGANKNKNSSLAVDISPKSNKENRNVNCKLRQTTLNFNTKLNQSNDSELEDTYCEGLDYGSIIKKTLYNEIITKPSKLSSLKNIAQEKVDNTVFDSPKRNKASILSSEMSADEIVKSTPTKEKISNKPKSLKKSSARTNLILRLPLSPTKRHSGHSHCNSQDNNDSDSGFIHLSQPDDVICLDDEKDEACTTQDIFGDIMSQVDTFADVLRKTDLSLAKKATIKKDQKKIEEKSPLNTGKDRKFPQIDCKECEKYFKYVGKDLSDEEILNRVRKSCKHKRTQNLHHTPEGFWDPHFRPFSPDDPRNETLIDTRFLHEK